MRLLGLDPGLRHTGWGVIEAAGNRLSHVADGVVHSDGRQKLAERLGQAGPKRAVPGNEPSPGGAARRDTADIEDRVWQKLRAGRLDGLKFRRREPILGLTVDFLCDEHRLIVELGDSPRDGKPQSD